CGSWCRSAPSRWHPAGRRSPGRRPDCARLTSAAARERSRYRAAVPAVLPDLSSDYAVPADRVAEFEREGHTVLRAVCTREEIAAYRPVIEAATKEHSTETRPIEA